MVECGMEGVERTAWFEKPLVAGVLASLGLAGLAVVYASGLAHQALLTGWPSIVVGAVLFVLVPIESAKERIRLPEVALWLFGFALDMVLLAPGALYPARDFSPQPHADAASWIAGLLFVALIIWEFYAVRKTSTRGLLPFIIALVQLWLGLIAAALSSMAISGSWL